jgi:hypothetical protein
VTNNKYEFQRHCKTIVHCRNTEGEAGEVVVSQEVEVEAAPPVGEDVAVQVL